MGIGASVFMIAVGAIITFAFNIRVGWLDLDVVGWVLMAAGAVCLLLTVMMINRRRTVVTNSTTQPTVLPPADPRQPVVEQRQYDTRY